MKLLSSLWLFLRKFRICNLFSNAMLAGFRFKNAYISNLSRSARYFFTLRFYRFESITTEMYVIFIDFECDIHCLI